MQTEFKHITGNIFFALIHLKSFFVYEHNWYRKENVRPAISKYYRTLREIIRQTNPRHRVLARCVNCNIFF